MERVVFLLPNRGERVSCMLNPEHLEIARVSGVSSVETLGVKASSANPVRRTNSGTTRMTLRLLFDLSLLPASSPFVDVRELTNPLWELSEASGEDSAADDEVRFIWGKSWNVPGFIESLSMTLEQFTAGGAPRRAWVTMSFLASAAPPSRTL